MRIQIFDVAHGFCAYTVADNGNVILIDAGHNEQTGFKPSGYLPQIGCTGIERFIVSNYDNDHVSDLPDLRSRIPINVLSRNPSITAAQLRTLKQQDSSIGSGIEELLNMIESYTADVSAETTQEFSGVELKHFWNSYPLFQDTNNLSLVTFLRYRDIHVIFTGDLERKGWLTLLQNSQFSAQLAAVNIFVASHHGRESGYCPEVFNHCRPEIIVISDGPIQYDSQQVNYGTHATGIRWHNGETRYTLTTRKDGIINISQDPTSNAQINSTS